MHDITDLPRAVDTSRLGLVEAWSGRKEWSYLCPDFPIYSGICIYFSCAVKRMEISLSILDCLRARDVSFVSVCLSHCLIGMILSATFVVEIWTKPLRYGFESSQVILFCWNFIPNIVR